MKTRKFLTVLSALGLLASCVQIDPHPMDMSQAVQSATTRPDHNALAKHYEDTAKEMQSKVQEHKKQLEEYENHSYNYGKRAQDLQGHCKGLIRYYGQAAEANSKMAEIHRQLAMEKLALEVTPDVPFKKGSQKVFLAQLRGSAQLS